MEIYRTIHGPFPGCPSHDVLQRMYRIALPTLSADDITECSLEALKKRDSKMFFPRRELIEDILSKEQIELVLKCDCVRCVDGRENSLPDFQALAKWVTKHARLLLAILIYLGHTRLIKEFQARSISDADLHKVITSISSRRPVGLSPGFKKSYETTLDLFSPPVFVMGDPKFNYDDNQRFPYLNDTHHKEGSFGKVRRFEIHPDYLDPSLQSIALKYAPPSAGDTGPGSCVFARKVLKYALRVEDFEMEWQTLRIIDQQRHHNIIDVIAFYSWRGELNCVFPFVELNLHDILHSSPSWKPEALAQPKRFPNHWLWLQMLGVADALKTIHNPPKQLRPDLGKIVGFHFDLKPSNILVTPDGTLKITDFGQSMVKMVQENEDVYGTFVGGDFAYGPPETCPSRIRVKALRANESRSTSSTATVLTNSQHHRTLSIPTPPSTAPSRRTSSIIQIDPLDQRRDSFFRVPFRNSTVQPPGEFSRRDSEAMSITAPSTAATSTASEDSGLIATANYDVWSLACIMTEVLDFIFLDGAAGVKRFEQARRDDPSERDLSFHNGSQSGQLKGCVHQLLNGLRDMDSHTVTVPGQPLTYMSETVGVLYEMFNPEPKFRLSSEQVVERFESITEKHKEDDDPNSNIIRYMKELGPPDGPGFKEHGYVREKDEDGKDTHDTSIVPFYNMPGIRFEINAQTIVDCRIQLFRKDGAVYFRVCYGDPFRSDKSHYFSTNSSFYCPLYLFDPAGRFMCSLSDQNVTRTLYFKTGLDLMTFQTAIMRHEALRGVKVSGVALHPKTRPKEIYNNLFDSRNSWPRCQFWKAKDPQYVLPRSSTASIKSPTQTPARARIVFFFGPASQSIFGIPLQDGKKKIFEVKDDGDAFDQPTRRIKFGRPDGFNKYFHYLKPNAESPRSPSSPQGYQQPCPMIPMNSTWLMTDESKTATRVDVAFTDHDDLVKFRQQIADANKANPFPTNKIDWQESVTQHATSSGDRIRKMSTWNTRGSVGS